MLLGMLVGFLVECLFTVTLF